ncbi:tyrosinase [Cyathus striatus]|nr:tyrosinase [Cyathus striatus]
MSRYVISGVPGGSLNRLEINDFVKNDQQFSLYVQALQYMYSHDPQDYTLSFFQVGGIHGLPYIPWDGSAGVRTPNEEWSGYCTHGSVLFPTWHRPYVMLFEQILHERAKAIADTYTVNKASWQAAANTLRQPFWDWARNAVPPAEVISLQNVTITTPDGKRTSVSNPLVRYRFHPIDQSFPTPYSGWQTTLRQPNNKSSSATDNVKRLRSILRNAQSNITSSTYNMLTRVHTWPAFSNHTVGDGGSTSNSLEAIHDGVHVNVGGRGHMGDPSVAGFDPIFFLHHANVDRLLSLWAALNPSVWVSKGDSESGTFTIPADVPVDLTTDLTPFWNAQTTFWASSGLHDTAKLGYTYPDFNGLDMGNTAAVQRAIQRRVNHLYGNRIFNALAALPPTTALSLSQAQPTAQSSDTPAAGLVQAASDNGGQQPLTAESVQSGSGDVSGGMWDWAARIHFNKYELGGSFSVLLFLGEVPEDPESWLVASNLVGAHHAFVNSAAGRCANCRTQADLVIEGFVHLNNGIAQHSGLGSLEPDVIHPYLKKELHWRVQKVDGTPVELTSLEVTVISTPLTLPPGSAFPVPGDAQHHHDITHGRQGGSQHA